MDTIGRIRREHFLKGKAIKEIARNLRVSRNTVRKELRSGKTFFTYDRERQPLRARTLVDGDAITVSEGCERGEGAFPVSVSHRA